jgi:signal peptidase I
VIVGAVIVAVVVKTVFIQAFRIPSESMDPTLMTGDRVLVNKLSYKLHDVHRGDVVVFDRPANLPAAPGDPDDLIKRVIGLPGDTVTARNGHVYVNNRRLDEPYLPSGTSTLTLRDDYSLERGIKVPKDEVLVMGDNRGNSQDGRVFGPIPEDSIVGRAFVIMWPFSRFASL